MGDLTFRAPDHKKYPSMDLSYAAGRAGGTMTGVLSAANEKAVELFIDEKYVPSQPLASQTSTLTTLVISDFVCKLQDFLPGHCEGD